MMLNMDWLVAFILIAGVPLTYIALQLRLLRRWRGGWRLAAALPVAVVAGWAANFAADVARDSTSHNLFPLEILIGAVGGLLYLGIVMTMRAVIQVVAGRRRTRGLT